MRLACREGLEAPRVATVGFSQPSPPNQSPLGGSLRGIRASPTDRRKADAGTASTDCLGQPVLVGYYDSSGGDSAGGAGLSAGGLSAGGLSVAGWSSAGFFGAASSDACSSAGSA